MPPAAHPTPISSATEEQGSIPAIMAPPPARDNPLTRSVAGVLGIGFLALMVIACLATLPWTLRSGPQGPRYDAQNRLARQISPFWWPTEGEAMDPDSEAARLRAVGRAAALERAAEAEGVSPAVLEARGHEPSAEEIAAATPHYLMGTDVLGRSLTVRVLAGGGISLTVGIAAALISVFLGTLYGALSGYIGGRVDALLMRIVDVLYGLPYILLVVLLAVAGDAAVDEFNTKAKGRERWIVSQAREVIAKERGEKPSRFEVRELLEGEREELKERFADPLIQAVGLVERIERPGTTAAERVEAELALGALPAGIGEAARRLKPRNLEEWKLQAISLVILLVAISGVSWLTMARVVRGQVLSLKNQPFMEAARAMGVPVYGQFIRHLLPNLLGPIIVYATLTVPQAILQESFLSFLGIGVRPPLPSWGNLAADGLVELNTYQSHWWLLLFPCLLLGLTLLALNFVGEGLREAFDPKRSRR
jgi:ABC-type dipeptide/oligopeptide/nickel transport system permease subunit